MDLHTCIYNTPSRAALYPLFPVRHLYQIRGAVIGDQDTYAIRRTNTYTVIIIKDKHYYTKAQKVYHGIKQGNNIGKVKKEEK